MSAHLTPLQQAEETIDALFEELEAVEHRTEEVQEIAETELDELQEEHNELQEALELELEENQEHLELEEAALQHCKVEFEAQVQIGCSEGRQEEKDWCTALENTMREEINNCTLQLRKKQENQQAADEQQDEIKDLEASLERVKEETFEAKEMHEECIRAQEKEQQRLVILQTRKEEMSIEADSMGLTGEQMEQTLLGLEGQFMWVEECCHEVAEERMHWEQRCESALQTYREAESTCRTFVEGCTEDRQSLREHVKKSEMHWLTEQRQLEDSVQQTHLRVLGEKRRLEDSSHSAELEACEIRAELELAIAKSDGLEADFAAQQARAEQNREVEQRRAEHVQALLSEELCRLKEEASQATSNEKAWHGRALVNSSEWRQTEEAVAEARARASELMIQKEQQCVGRLRAELQLVEATRLEAQLRAELRSTRREAQTARREKKQMNEVIDRGKAEDRKRMGQASGSSSSKVGSGRNTAASSSSDVDMSQSRPSPSWVQRKAAGAAELEAQAEALLRVRSMERHRGKVAADSWAVTAAANASMPAAALSSNSRSSYSAAALPAGTKGTWLTAAQTADAKAMLSADTLAFDARPSSMGSNYADAKAALVSSRSTMQTAPPSASLYADAKAAMAGGRHAMQATPSRAGGYIMHGRDDAFAQGQSGLLSRELPRDALQDRSHAAAAAAFARTAQEDSRRHDDQPQSLLAGTGLGAQRRASLPERTLGLGY